MELAEKLRNRKKHNNEKHLAYDATYNKNNPEIFTEIMKNPEKIKDKDKNQEILDTTKIIKSQREPKNLKRILTSSPFGENTTQEVTKCNNERCKVCDIIIEVKFYTFKNIENKFKINKKKLSCNSQKVVYIIECNECKEIYIGSTQPLIQGQYQNKRKQKIKCFETPIPM